MEGRIPLVIGAGPTTHGLESTIVSVQEGKIDILRSGPVTQEQLEQFDEVSLITAPDRISAPGQLPVHYSPTTPLQLIENCEQFSLPAGKRVGLLAWHHVHADPKYAAIRCLSERQNLHDAATNLFRQLRELDAMGLDLIVTEHVPEEGLGVAIMDRLRRAAGG